MLTIFNNSMQEININVRVQIGVTDQLCSLLSAFAKHVAPAAAPVPPTEPAHQQQPAVVEAAPETPAAPVEVGQPAPIEQPAPEVPAPVNEAKELTEADVRAAMDRTRRRIEGENYKEDTTSEGYKKWHRALTGWFKATAMLYGADKPSALPDHASRKNFIADCDQVQIKDGGFEIPGGEDCPY